MTEPMAPPPAAPPPMAPPPMMAAAPMVRPTGATVITVIEAILGVLLLIIGVAAMGLMGIAGGLAGSSGDPGAAGVGGLLAGIGAIIGIVFIGIALLYFAIAYGVWKGRGWSWMLGVVFSIIVLVFSVLGLSGGINVSNIISIALPAVVLYFLFQPEVKRWLGRPA